MTFKSYPDAFEILPEFQLSKAPLKIDCVIIKKLKDVEISATLASGFRGVNLIEYKSPTDYVSVEDYYKVYGYACLYRAQERVPFKDLSLTFIESRDPQKLLRYLTEEKGFTVAENTPGIYTVTGADLPIQIVNNRKLASKDDVWLRSLYDKLNSHEVQQITEVINRQEQEHRAEDYFNVLYRANRRIFEEVIKMTSTEFIQQTVAHKKLVAEAVAEAEAKAFAKSKAEVLKLLDQGLSVEEIRQRLK
ncbi:MAG: hypothetical protein FWH12_09590 [Treponema sp.]|nr:hypothetical protein [Treponema sp.]